MTVVAGVSGSGKSKRSASLLPRLATRASVWSASIRCLTRKSPAPNRSRGRWRSNQSPIGRTPRSVPATFLGVWDEIRRLYASTNEAEDTRVQRDALLVNSARAGRCTACDGQSVIHHEMSFSADVVTVCEACNGSRFDPADRRGSLPSLESRCLEAHGRGSGRCVSRASQHSRPSPRLFDLASGTFSSGKDRTPCRAARRSAEARGRAHRGRRDRAHRLRSRRTDDRPAPGRRDAPHRRSLPLGDRGDTLVVIEHIFGHCLCEHVIELGPKAEKRVAASSPRVPAERLRSSRRDRQGAAAHAGRRGVTLRSEHADELAWRALFARAARFGAHVANGERTARLAGAVYERPMPQCCEEDRFAAFTGRAAPLFARAGSRCSSEPRHRAAWPIRLVAAGHDLDAAALDRASSRAVQIWRKDRRSTPRRGRRPGATEHRSSALPLVMSTAR